MRKKRIDTKACYFFCENIKFKIGPQDYLFAQAASSSIGQRGKGGGEVGFTWRSFNRILQHFKVYMGKSV